MLEALNGCGTLSGGPGFLDLKEGANSCAWNDGFEGRKEISLMFLSKLDSKDTEEYLFFRIEGSEYVILGLFSQVLKGLERFVVFEKIWEIRSSGPKILLVLQMFLYL